MNGFKYNNNEGKMYIYGASRIESHIKPINRKLTKTAVLLALALAFQIGRMPLAQPVVGPLVNMTLLIATIVVGPGQAVMIGSLTPLMAFMLGIMPIPVLVPVVMLGNAAFIMIFSYLSNRLSKKYPLIALLAASFAKFTVMAVMTRLITSSIMPGLPVKLIHAFSLPQLYTALLGGMMASIILRYMPHSIRVKQPG